MKRLILLIAICMMVGSASANAFSAWTAYGDAWKATQRNTRPTRQVPQHYLHVTAETSALTVGGSGNMLLLELIRDYANDTDTDAARFISLRIKYGRTV